MTHLTIPSPQPTAAKIQAAAELLSALLKLKKPAENEVSRKKLEDLMHDAPLSDWVSLYIHVIFDHIYGEDAAKREAFIDSSRNLLLAKFSREYHSIPSKLKRFQAEQHRFFAKSYTDLCKVMQDSAAISVEIKRLEQIYTQPKDERLALFLIAEKVIFLLDKMAMLSSQHVLLIKKNMAMEPMRFLMDIVPVLIELQSIAPNEEAILAMPKLDQAIDATLKLLGFKDDNTAMVFLIRDDLVEHGFLNLVEDEPDVVLGSDRGYEADGSTETSPSPV